MGTVTKRQAGRKKGVVMIVGRDQTLRGHFGSVLSTPRLIRAWLNEGGRGNKVGQKEGNGIVHMGFALSDNSP